MLNLYRQNYRMKTGENLPEDAVVYRGLAKYPGDPGCVVTHKNTLSDVKRAMKNRNEWVEGDWENHPEQQCPEGQKVAMNEVAMNRYKSEYRALPAYEGVDERAIARSVDDEVSIGDYVLSGGELAAMVLIDCIVRQLPGALGDTQSAVQESFVGGLLDCPQYTRPEQYEGLVVPAVLMSGNHADIGRWRLKQSLGRTWQRRPALLEQRGMSVDECGLLEEFKQELSGV